MKITVHLRSGGTVTQTRVGPDAGSLAEMRERLARMLADKSMLILTAQDEQIIPADNVALIVVSER